MSDVQDIIRSLDYSDSEIADFLKVSRAMVNRWRSGKAVPRETNYENLLRLQSGMKILRRKNKEVISQDVIEDLIERLGGVIKTAKLVNRSTQLVYQWRWGKSVPSTIDYRTMIRKIKEIESESEVEVEVSI